MFNFGKGPEVGTENKIFKLPNHTEYELQTGRSIIPGEIKSAEKPTRVSAAADLLRAVNEVE